MIGLCCPARPECQPAHSAKGGQMKAKATWKPVGLSAKRWRNAAQTKGPSELRLPHKPPREKELHWAAPREIELDSLGRPGLKP